MEHKTIFLLTFLFVASACANFPDISEDSQAGESTTTAGASTDSSDEAATTASSGTTTPSSASGNDVEPSEPLVDPQGLVINEILYDVPGSDTDGQLFVELYAQGAGDLEGYGVHFVNGGDGKVTDRIDLPSGMSIGDTDFFVIADGRTGALETTQVSYYNFIDNFDPQNGPDGVQLIDRNNQTIDSVVYGSGAVTVSEEGLALGEGIPALDVDSGWSLARSEAGIDSDDNAHDFIGLEQPTPGE